MSIVTKKPLIYAAEAWTCDPDADILRPQTAISTLPRTGAKSVVERVAAEFAPVIVQANDLHIEGGELCDFSALLGIPVIVTNKVVGCIVLAIHCADDAMGAFEIWKRDERDELGLDGAVFAGLRRFASISQYVRFPRGSGLPGQSWEDAESKLITGLGSSPNFMRAAGARAGGLEVGVALPIFTSEHDLNSVILLLSSKTTPIARAFELWGIDGEQAVLRKSACVSQEATVAEAHEMSYVRGEGVVGKVWETGHAFVSDDLASVERKRFASLSSDGMSNVIAMPVFVGSQLESVFVMWN